MLNFSKLSLRFIWISLLFNVQPPAVVCRGLTFCDGGGDYKIKIKIQTENLATEQDINRLQVAKIEFILKVQILQC